MRDDALDCFVICPEATGDAGDVGSAPGVAVPAYHSHSTEMRVSRVRPQGAEAGLKLRAMAPGRPSATSVSSGALCTFETCAL